MKPNNRKPLRLQNRTKFFDPNKDKAFVQFNSPESYMAKQMKTEGYETRLYWQYKYCESVGGQTFFYTLTYADKNLPVKYGTNCFDYEDLRDLMTGGFRKQLLRKYGTGFKYFIGAELGDGKGKRGLENNPHYHALFFLEPKPHTIKTKRAYYVPIGKYKRNTRYHYAGQTKYKKCIEWIEEEVPYTKISEKEFQHLIRKYWQGFDQDTDGRKDFRTETKYGIVKEGRYGALVRDFRACSYVAKYCVKDIRLKSKEINIRALLNLKLRNELKNSLEFHKDFFTEVVYPLYNIPKNAKGEWKYDEQEMMNQIQPEILKKYIEPEHMTCEETFVSDVKRLCYRLNLWPKYNNFLYERIDLLISTAITEWRNRYSNKCRISQGVGEYALDFIDDLKNPMIEVPDAKKGLKQRPIPMYLYRKLYTTVIYPTFKDFQGKYHKCNPTRILNEQGIAYKVEQLKDKLEKMTERAENTLEFILTRPDIFDEMKQSDVNTEVWFSLNYIKDKYNEYKNNGISGKDICRIYSAYKLVYQDRYYTINEDRDTGIIRAPHIQYFDDYAKFLIPSIYSVDRSDLYLDCFLEANHKDYLEYGSHPYFLPYISFINLLDLCTDYFFIQDDIKKENEAKRINDIRKFHKLKELHQWYRNLANA